MIPGRSPNKQASTPSVLDAIYRTVHDYGVDQLARQTGQSSGVIDNKANPHETTYHKPTVADVMVWQTITKDHRILHAMAHALGEVCLPLPDVSNESDEGLFELMCTIGSESGNFFAGVRDALTDHRVDGREVTEIERAGLVFIAAITAAVGRIKSMAEVRR